MRRFEVTQSRCIPLLARLMDRYAEHGITGEVLVHLDHEALKDVGIHSVGQRLAVLKAVYSLKVQQNVPVEEGHYIPPCQSRDSSYTGRY